MNPFVLFLALSWALWIAVVVFSAWILRRPEERATEFRFAVVIIAGFLGAVCLGIAAFMDKAAS